MKLPRDLTGKKLIETLEKMGYHATRHTGSYMRLPCGAMSQHTITVPRQDPLRIGTLAAILADMAVHHELARDDLIFKLFGKS
jgi:predicted RNA binding protein YcfA (HicA-like mRNA interferase family)